MQQVGTTKSSTFTQPAFIREQVQPYTGQGEAIEVLFSSNLLFLGSLEDFSYSNNKRYLIMYYEALQRMNPIFKQKFNVIISFSTLEYSVISGIFLHQVWEKQEKTVNKDWNRIKLAAYTDESLQILCQLRQEFDIRGERSFAVYNNKYKTYEALGEIMCVPKSIILEPINLKKEEALSEQFICSLRNKLGNFPYFAKPSNAGGSQMTLQIRNQETLQDYIRQWNSSHFFKIDKILLSQFIDCELYQIDMLIMKGKIVGPIMVSYNVGLWHRYLQGSSVGLIVLQEGSQPHQKYSALANQIVSTLKPPTGGLDIEFFERENGEPVILEINARRPGQAVNNLYQQLTGKDLESLSIVYQWGYDIEVSKQKKSRHIGFVDYPHRQGIIKQILEIKVPNNSEMRTKFNVKTGEKTKKAMHIGTFAIRVLLINDNYQKLREDWEYLKDSNPMIYESA